MFAVIETGGKQYLVKSGEAIKIEKLAVDVGGVVTFDKVLMVADEDGLNVEIGKPYLAGMTVTGTVAEQGRGKKIVVVKYKRKVRYTRTRGHRQHFTKVKLEKLK